MGARVTFKPGGPSCPGGPRTPAPGDPCVVAEHTACPLAGGHWAARGTEPPRVAPQGWGAPHSPGTRGHLPSPLWLQRTPWLPAKTSDHEEGLGGGGTTHRQHLLPPPPAPQLPMCILLTSSPGSPGSPNLPGSPWQGRRSKKQGWEMMCRASSCRWTPPAMGRQLGSPGPPWFPPHQPPRAALTFSPLGPGKPRSPLEPYQGESSIRGGGGHKADLASAEGMDWQQGGRG